MVRSYQKNLNRMFRSNILRLFAISLIVAIGVAVASGICAIPLQIREALKSAALSMQEVFVVNEMADKVELIANVLPPFFIAVSVLTVVTTLTRLVEEERRVIACYKTLGYSNFSIVFRFIIFSFTCASIGCVIGLVLGNFVLRPFIFNVITIKFNVPFVDGFFLEQGIIWAAAMSVCIIVTSLVISLLYCKEIPSKLLRNKAPKAGKKVFLEFLPHIWKRLKFKLKSSIRNILRFKGKLIMTIITIGGSTAMLFVGLGLVCSVNSTQNQALASVDGFKDSMNAIAVIITICGVALAVLVLLNLTNINIEERKIELATLKVLGYNRFEVAGYIYRETLMLSIVGILLGLPCGYFLVGFLFDYLDFGTVDLIEWYVWIGSLAIAAFSVFFADVLLFNKIDRIEMTTSLKVVE